MGGGSSDAAALLRALFDHFKPAQSDHDLYKIAQKIGADVPVCLREKPTLMRGTGDILEDFALKDLKLPNDLHAVLIWSDGGETTERLYKELDLADITTQNFDNDFMHVAPKLCPAINDAIDYLEQSNQCFKIGLSGSGTTVFGLCKKEFVSEPHNFSWLKTCSIITNR